MHSEARSRGEVSHPVSRIGQPSPKAPRGRIGLLLWIVFAAVLGAGILGGLRGMVHPAPLSPRPFTANPQLTSDTEATSAWLAKMTRALALHDGGGHASRSNGFTAAEFDALVRAGRSAATLPDAIAAAATSLHARGRLATALEGYRAVLEVDGRRTGIARAAASVEASIATIIAALETQQAAAVAEPAEPAHRIALGRSYRLLERRDPALFNLAEALRLDPASVPATIETVRVHLALGSPEEARRIAQRCLTRAPENVDFHRLAAEIALLDAGESPAIEHFDRACLAPWIAGRTLDRPAPPVSLCWIR